MWRDSAKVEINDIMLAYAKDTIIAISETGRAFFSTKSCSPNLRFGVNSTFTLLAFTTSGIIKQKAKPTQTLKDNKVEMAE